jgi:hypothetical protein
MRAAGTRLLENLWQENREAIEAAVGLPLIVNGSAEKTRFLSVEKVGPDHRDHSDWENQFQWYFETTHALKRALIGDVPFEMFTWNLLTPEVQEQALTVFPEWLEKVER